MTKKISKYLSLVKFSHTIFGLPFALIGFTYAVSQVGTDGLSLKLLLVLLCMVLARNAAMGFNRYADRHFDKLNPRTAQREIPAGVISERRAAWFIAINCILFIVTTYFLNSLVFYLSPIALAVVLGYSLTKRFSALCHLVLGVALGIAPVGAYIAVVGEFAWLPMILSVVVMCWVGGFDILYALQDEEFDRDNKLHSIPATLGRRGALRVSLLLHFISIVLITVIGVQFEMDFIYWIGASIFSIILAWEHIVVTPENISRVNLAFATMNGAASLIFALFTILSFVL